MEWIDFLKTEIENGQKAPPWISRPIVDLTVKKYQRGTYDNLSALVNNARSDIHIGMVLDKGITAPQYAKRYGVSYKVASRILKRNATAKYKGKNGAWVYRGCYAG